MASSSSSQPNVLFIFTDQHRLSACSPYGETPCHTPNMERLAGRSIRFDQAYTTCPVCTPARSSIITGLFPHSNGLRTNIGQDGCRVDEIPDTPNLLSRKLQQQGYNLGYSGKWHLGSKTLPRDIGFRGHNCPGHGNGGFGFSEYKDYLEKNGFQHDVKESVRGAGILQESQEATVPYFLTSNTINLMEEFRQEDGPFFIWHNFWGPHAPYFVPQEFYEMYENVEIPPWPNYEWPAKDIGGPHQATIHPLSDDYTWEDWAHLIRHYYAFTTLIDYQIGRLLDYLEETGLAENTVIIFAADHGETLGSHGGLMNKGYHHFEETHHIPFMIRDPYTQNRKATENRLVSLADVYPTVLDLAGGLEEAPRLHGRSLLPLLRDEPTTWRDQVVTEFNGVDNTVYTMRTLRWDKYKYGYNHGHFDELYDLANDPYETQNLVHDPNYKEILDEGRERLLQWMKETRDNARSCYVRKNTRFHPEWMEGSPSLIGNPVPEEEKNQ